MEIDNELLQNRAFYEIEKNQHKEEMRTGEKKVDTWMTFTIVFGKKKVKD